MCMYLISFDPPKIPICHIPILRKDIRKETFQNLICWMFHNNRKRTYKMLASVASKETAYYAYKLWTEAFLKLVSRWGLSLLVDYLSIWSNVLRVSIFPFPRWSSLYGWREIFRRIHFEWQRSLVLWKLPTDWWTPMEFWTGVSSYLHFQVATQNLHSNINYVMILSFKFEEGVLEICFHLLRRANGGRVNAVMMSDPVKMSRTISKIVGSQSMFHDISVSCVYTPVISFLPLSLYM